MLLVPDFSNLSVPLERNGGNLAHFYTVVPIFSEERDFELQHGMEAFLEELVNQKVPTVVDVDRARIN